MEPVNKRIRTINTAKTTNQLRINVIIAILIIVVLASSVSYAQNEVFQPIYVDVAPKLAAQYGLDTTGTGAVRAAFDTTSDSNVRELSALFLAERGISDIAPRVKQLFTVYWQREFAGPPYNYVVALYLLRDAEAKQYLHSLIDSVLVRKQAGMIHDGFFYIRLAIRLLFNLGDYSRYNLLNSHFDDLVDTPNGSTLNMLAAFADIPQYRDSVYLRLQDFLTHPERDYRWHAVFNLTKYPEKPDLQSILRTVAEDDTTVDVQHEAIDGLKKIYHDPFVFNVLASICLKTTDSLDFRYSMLKIEFFNHLLAYPTLVRIMNALPPGAFKDDATHSVNFYRPPEPNKSVPPLVMLDSLISYKHQAFALGWILEEGVVTSLDSKLEAARAPIINDRPSAIQILQSFINELDALNTQGNQITREAYVFLKPHARYLIERL